jgi:hypothetical protein
MHLTSVYEVLSYFLFFCHRTVLVHQKPKSLQFVSQEYQEAGAMYIVGDEYARQTVTSLSNGFGANTGIPNASCFPNYRI